MSFNDIYTTDFSQLVKYHTHTHIKIARKLGIYVVPINLNKTYQGRLNLSAIPFQAFNSTNTNKTKIER